MNNENLRMGLLIVILVLCSFFLGYQLNISKDKIKEMSKTEELFGNKVYTYDYIWVNPDKKIDLTFLALCDEFIIGREYINKTYMCVNFSNDFQTMMNMFGYPVESMRICPPENYTSSDCHRLNFIKNLNSYIFIEPQTCKTYDNYDEMYLHYFPKLNVTE